MSTAKERVFAYLDQNHRVGLAELQEIFDDIKPNTVKDYLKQWRNDNPDKSPEPKGNLVKVVFDYLDQNPTSSVSTLKKQFPDIKEGTLGQYKTRWNKKSRFTLSDLEGRVDILVKMADEYKQSGIDALKPPGSIDIKKPFRPVNFSLMESLHDEFVKVCKSLEIPQRQGIHRAMKMFIESTSRE